MSLAVTYSPTTHRSTAARGGYFVPFELAMVMSKPFSIDVLALQPRILDARVGSDCMWVGPPVSTAENEMVAFMARAMYWATYSNVVCCPDPMLISPT